jgi:hypothetical protein
MHFAKAEPWKTNSMRKLSKSHRSLLKHRAKERLPVKIGRFSYRNSSTKEEPAVVLAHLLSKVQARWEAQEPVLGKDRWTPSQKKI